MINNKEMMLLLVIIILVALPLSSAAPPASTVQVSDTSLQLEYPKYNIIKLGNTHRFHVHVINATSIKTNKTTSCYLHLYNQTGYDITSIPTKMEWEDYGVPELDFALTVAGGNFSKVGQYSYVIECNTSTEVGFASGQLDVTPNGYEATTHGLLAEPLLLLAISIMFLVSAITFNNKRWLVKSALYLVTLLFLIMTVNSSLDFVLAPKSNSMLMSAYILLVFTTVLAFIVIIVYYLKSLVKAITQAKSEKKEDLL